METTGWMLAQPSLLSYLRTMVLTSVPCTGATKALGCSETSVSLEEGCPWLRLSKAGLNSMEERLGGGEDTPSPAPRVVMLRLSHTGGYKENCAWLLAAM